MDDKSREVASAGQALWQKAKRIIPGGNMLLSKRPEMFLPDQWPPYFSKASGCEVWDLDGNHFYDLSLMGVGTNLLGYGHPEVDAAVHETIRLGNMSSLNSPEEVALAEQLLLINSWAGQVRFTRSGGEANAIAIRIARAHSGKDLVAVCGYHGWHDWYLAANLSGDGDLDGHLLPGLEPKGVPRGLAGTVKTFEYNQIQDLEALLAEFPIGVIKMEVQRNVPPENEFLQRVRNLADKFGAILIFDECTSGFRETFGGLHQKYDVEPDMAILGKALGNGYAIAAVVGRAEIMGSAQGTFISSTFWSERIGPSAALKTLNVMEQLRSWEIVSQIGREAKAVWGQLSNRYGIPISISGLDALASFTFGDSENHQVYRSFITQEMLAKGFLAATTLYASVAHSRQVLDNYYEALDVVFSRISRLGPEGVAENLRGEPAHTGFHRLN